MIAELFQENKICYSLKLILFTMSVQSHRKIESIISDVENLVANIKSSNSIADDLKALRQSKKELSVSVKRKAFIEKQGGKIESALVKYNKAVDATGIAQNEVDRLREVKGEESKEFKAAVKKEKRAVRNEDRLDDLWQKINVDYEEELVDLEDEIEELKGDVKDAKEALVERKLLNSIRSTLTKLERQLNSLL